MTESLPTPTPLAATEQRVVGTTKPSIDSMSDMLRCAWIGDTNGQHQSGFAVRFVENPRAQREPRAT